jgi:hypothetical protein
VGVPKFPQLRFLRLWGSITLRANLQLRLGIKKSCSPCRELFNAMLHVTCTQGNRGDTWLLVVGSQIANLTPSLSFVHNLCLKCPNGSCEPISDIYVPRDFQWYKELFNSMGFDPLQLFFEDSGVNWDSNSQSGSSLGSVKVHSLTLSCTPRSMKCDSRASHLARTFTSPCLGREPKARVATSFDPFVFSSIL